MIVNGPNGKFFTGAPFWEGGNFHFFIDRAKRSEEERKELRNPTMFINSIQDGQGRELTWLDLSVSNNVPARWM